MTANACGITHIKDRGQVDGLPTSGPGFSSFNRLKTMRQDLKMATLIQSSFHTPVTVTHPVHKIKRMTSKPGRYAIRLHFKSTWSLIKLILLLLCLLKHEVFV